MIRAGTSGYFKGANFRGYKISWVLNSAVDTPKKSYFVSITRFLMVRENLENCTFFSKTQGKPEKVREKNKIMTKSGKNQGIFSVISLFFICLSLTYIYQFFINIYWYH